MGKIYGYARVSTPTQRLDRQIKNIEEYCKDKKIEKIYAEKYTGTKIERPQFSQLLKIIHPGDTIIFDSVSRMSRTAEEGYNLYMQLLHQGVDLMFIKEPHINTEYYKRMQNRKYEIAHTGKKSIDNLICIRCHHRISRRRNSRKNTHRISTIRKGSYRSAPTYFRRN